MIKLVSCLPRIWKRENFLSYQNSQIPQMLQQPSNCCFTFPLQCVRLRIQSLLPIFLVMPIFLRQFLLHTLQDMGFILIPMVIRICGKPSQEGKMDCKLLSQLSYCFFSQLLFPSKTCQFTPSDPDVIIAWLSTKRWFSVRAGKPPV